MRNNTNYNQYLKEIDLIDESMNMFGVVRKSNKDYNNISTSTLTESEQKIRKQKNKERKKSRVKNRKK